MGLKKYIRKYKNYEIISKILVNKNIVFRKRGCK